MKAPNITASSATATFSARRRSQCATAMRRACIGALPGTGRQARWGGRAPGCRRPVAPPRQARRALVDGVDRIERALGPVVAVAIEILLLRKRPERGDV